MSETITEVKPDATVAVVEPLEATTHETCDGHASGGVSAVFAILLATGGELTLCRHCAIRGGYATHETITWLTDAEGGNRNKGEAHA